MFPEGNMNLVLKHLLQRMSFVHSLVTMLSMGTPCSQDSTFRGTSTEEILILIESKWFHIHR